jgi:hypothetical protein
MRTVSHSEKTFVLGVGIVLERVTEINGTDGSSSTHMELSALRHDFDDEHPRKFARMDLSAVQIETMPSLLKMIEREVTRHAESTTFATPIGVIRNHFDKCRNMLQFSELVAAYVAESHHA